MTIRSGLMCSLFLSGKDNCNPLLRFDAGFFLERFLATIHSGLMRVSFRKESLQPSAQACCMLLSGKLLVNLCSSLMRVSFQDPCNHLLRFDAGVFLERILATMRSGLMMVSFCLKRVLETIRSRLMLGLLFLKRILASILSRLMPVSFWQSSL